MSTAARLGCRSCLELPVEAAAGVQHHGCCEMLCHGPATGVLTLPGAPLVLRRTCASWTGGTGGGRCACAWRSSAGCTRSTRRRCSCFGRACAGRSPPRWPATRRCSWSTGTPGALRSSCSSCCAPSCRHGMLPLPAHLHMYGQRIARQVWPSHVHAMHSMHAVHLSRLGNLLGRDGVVVAQDGRV